MSITKAFHAQSFRFRLVKRGPVVSLVYVEIVRDLKCLGRGHKNRFTPYQPMNTLVLFLATFDVLIWGHNAVMMAEIIAIIIG